MPRISILLFVFSIYFVSASSYADDSNVGIGVGINSPISIFLPMNVGDYLIEPSIYYLTRDRDVVDIDGSTRSSRETKTITLSIGVFLNKLIKKNTHLYYGARFGYKVSERKNTRSTLFSSSVDNTESTGYLIAPTIGVYYDLSEKFSMGLDLEYEYSRLSGDDKVTRSNIENNKTKRITSNGTVIIRYRF